MNTVVDLSPDSASSRREKVLSDQERSTLASLEKTIEKGKLVFLIVGAALCRIKSERLYRATHDRFEDYVFARFRFTRQHAYRFIQA
jgi:hypothetical protein